MPKKEINWITKNKSIRAKWYKEWRENTREGQVSDLANIEKITPASQEVGWHEAVTGGLENLTCIREQLIAQRRGLA